MYRFALAALLALAACATPQQQCIRTATKDLLVIDNLIAETAGNIERGYALTTRTQTSTYWQFCASPNRHVHWCAVPRTTTKQVPVAIDLSEERKKLASLKAKREELLLKAEREVAACKATYPD